MDSRPDGDHGRRLEQAAELRAARTSGCPADADIRHRVNDAREEARRQRKQIDDSGRADYLIRDAMARGEFDNLEYAGKPIPGLGGAPDPDWWIKGVIQREHLTGLGPKAILLRSEDAGLDDRLDTLGSAQQVREVVEDFNARVIDARRQLQGGPPVVTKTRDADREVVRWQERRAARAAVARVVPAPQAGLPWWRRMWRGPL
ncbi:MAG: DUF1992 domain-containing protein [Actinomycetota bacterium]|nr:DUF1992 domain-containing protein [Actinomycetota bacterium]